MGFQRINERILTAFQSSNTSPDDIKSFEGLLRDNLAQADTNSQRAVNVFATITSIWVLLQAFQVNEVSILGIKVSDIPLVLAVLPPIAAFAYYQFMCMEGLTTLIDTALRAIYHKRLKTFSDVKLTALLAPPTMHHIEAAIANLLPGKGFLQSTSKVWQAILAIIFVILPIAILSWMMYLVIMSNSVSLGWKIASISSTIILIIRSFLLFIEWIIMV